MEKETPQISPCVPVSHVMHRSQQMQEAVELFDGVCLRKEKLLLYQQM